MVAAQSNMQTAIAVRHQGRTMIEPEFRVAFAEAHRPWLLLQLGITEHGQDISVEPAIAFRSRTPMEMWSITFGLRHHAGAPERTSLKMMESMSA